MKIQELRYQADGLAMVGRIFLPDGNSGPRPGVLVFPHAFGPGEHSGHKCERLAEDFGYVALECDLYGGARHVGGLNEVMDLQKPMREHAQSVRARTLEPLKVLAARPEVDPAKIAAIGFCFGGVMAYELALAGEDLKAAIGFHSGLKVTSPGDAHQIKGKVMTLIGADDPTIPAEDREAFTRMLAEAGVDYTMTVYGGVVHSFTDKDADHIGMPQVARYDANADRRSWAAMADILEEVLV